VRAVRRLAGIVLAMGIVTILFIPDLFETDLAEEIPWVIGVSVIVCRSETCSCWSGCVSVFVDDAAEHSRL
jgi:hypothetical protein